MADADKTREQLLDELATARKRIAELEAVEAEQERTAQILQESEARYRLLVENPLIGVFLLDEHYTFIYANAEVARIFGYPPEAVIGMDYRRIIREGSLPIIQAVGERRSLGDTSLARYEIEILRHDGETRTVENATLMIVGTSGQQEVLGMVRDVTEHNQAEKALRESQNSLQTLMDASPVAISWADLDGKIQYCNRKFTELFGYTLDDIPTRTCWYERAYPDPAYREEVRAFWNASIDWAGQSPGNEITSQQVTITCKDGSLRQVTIAGALVSNRILAIFTDLTSHKQAEREIAEWKRRYEFVAAASGQVIYDCNFADSTITWGGSVEQVLGYQLSEMQGGFPQWEALMDPNDLQETISLLTVAEASEKSFEAEYGYRHKDGHYIRMMDRGFILPNPGGKPEHLIGVMQDITERKRAEKQQLELALERERSETFRTLVGNIAHDIKTPLSTINTSLYLMQHYTDTQNYPQRIETIKDQVRVLSSFVQDLMTMARLEGEPEFHPILLNLTEMIVAVEMEFHPLIEQKNIYFTLNVDEQLPLLLLDQAAIRRMMTNLIENAINYTPMHGSIKVQTRQQESNVVLEVMDTGIGIAEADLPHIFERFYRSDQARTAVNTGSGLGLAIVKRVVEMHGGEVEVESRVGEGTVFRVFLPVQ